MPLKKLVENYGSGGSLLKADRRRRLALIERTPDEPIEPTQASLARVAAAAWHRRPVDEDMAHNTAAELGPVVNLRGGIYPTNRPGRRTRAELMID